MARLQELTSHEVAQAFLQDRSLLEASKRPQLLSLIRAFVAPNEDPNASANYRSDDPDPVRCFIDMLLNTSVQTDAEAVLLLFKAVKILSRKKSNRMHHGPDGVRCVLLNLAPPLSIQIASEGANALLNFCYEQQNVDVLLHTTGVRQLIGFLSENNLELQANAAGAIQSVCFLAKGRQHVREYDGIQSLLPLLSSPHPKVVSRAAGAIHNLSSDGDSIQTIRKYAGIPRLVELLSHENIAVAGSAAGALQNVSRELASRCLIGELDAVPALAVLLSSADVHAQVCAAGALLNILGPELESGMHGPGSSKRTLGNLMAMIMATAIVFYGVFETRPELE